MTDLTKVKISLILASARFWVIIIVLYLMTKNLSEEQIFQTIGFYYLVALVMEYPTGVIGDYFSHKASVIWGYLIAAIAILSLTFITSLWHATLFYIVYALGASLISGSDTALLHSVSKNFKRDMSQVKIYSTLTSATALSIGGWLGSIDLKYPFYLNFLFFLVAILFLLFVKKHHQEKMSGNIFATAKEGLRHTFSNKQLFHLIIVSSATSAFYFNLKWLYNPLFLELNIDVKFWGILGGIALLFIAFGAFIYKKIPETTIYFGMSLLIASLFLMGMTEFVVISIVGLFLVHFVRGFMGTKLTVDINKTVNPKLRASVLSLRSFMIRLGASAIVFISGYLLEAYSFSVLMFAIATILLMGSLHSLLKIRKFELT